jgi:photosystem II stability/assembly factor-like uncharacterized protein
MRLFLGTRHGVFRVNPDNGLVTRLGPLDTSVESVAVHGEVIIAAVTPDYGLPMRAALGPSHRAGAVRSLDSGIRWTPCAGALAQASVTALAWGGGGFIAGTDPAGILHSYDAGATWTEGAPLRALPGAEHWGYPLPPWTAHVMDILPHPQRSTVVYVGIEVGGLAISVDSGCNWSAIGTAVSGQTIHPDVHGIAICASSPHVMYAATPDGVYVSETSGAAWEARSHGLEPLYCRPIAVHPGDPDVAVTVVAHGAAGFFGKEAMRSGARVLRTADRGRTWAPASGLPDVFAPTPGLIADPEAPGRFFMATFSGEVFASDDGGAIWRLHAEGLPSIFRMIAA